MNHATITIRRSPSCNAFSDAIESNEKRPSSLQHFIIDPNELCNRREVKVNHWHPLTNLIEPTWRWSPGIRPVIYIIDCPTIRLKFRSTSSMNGSASAYEHPLHHDARLRSMDLSLDLSQLSLVMVLSANCRAAFIARVPVDVR